MASVRLTKADLEKYPHLAKRINASLLESERDELPKGEQGVDVKCKRLEPHNNQEEAVRLIRRKLSLIVVACLALGLFGTVAYASVGLDSNMVELIRSLIREEATNQAVTNTGSPSNTYHPPQPTVPDPPVPDPQVATLKTEIARLNQELAQARYKADLAQQRLGRLGKPLLGINPQNHEGWIYVTGTVDKSGARLAGIPVGSFITHINNEPVKFDTLREVLWKYVPNETIEVTYRHNGYTKTTNLRLDRNPEY